MEQVEEQRRAGKRIVCRVVYLHGREKGTPLRFQALLNGRSTNSNSLSRGHVVDEVSKMSLAAAQQQRKRNGGLTEGRLAATRAF